MLANEKDNITENQIPINVHNVLVGVLNYLPYINNSILFCLKAKIRNLDNSVLGKITTAKK